MTRGLSETLPTLLPARYERLFAWQLDRRCKVARNVAADLFELWQDLGGVERLSVQKRWLCERVVYLRRHCIVYETAVLTGTEPPFDAGTYSNHANVLQGYLRALGLERRAKSAMGLHEFMAAKTALNGAAADAERSDRPSAHAAGPSPAIDADKAACAAEGGE
jgi:hypothetical protein